MLKIAGVGKDKTKCNGCINNYLNVGDERCFKIVDTSLVLKKETNLNTKKEQTVKVYSCYLKPGFAYSNPNKPGIVFS